MFSVNSLVGRTALLGVLSLYCSVSSPALAEDTGATNTGATNIGLHLPKRTASDAEQMAPEAMLSDLRDTRLTLTQLKQQSINLFLEATRPCMTVNDAPMEQSPSTISLKMLDPKRKYLPPRKEWLVLYINTLEPLVQLLCEDINDIDTNGRKVSKAIEERINPLWSTWRNNVLSINKSLDQVQGSLPVGDDKEDAQTNEVIAKAALDIFQRIEELEKIRYHVTLISIEEYKKDAGAKSSSASAGMR